MEKELPREKPAPAAEVAARDDVRAAASPVRCPFCHAGVEPREETWVACWGCLARHHAECWDEQGRCASCSHDRFLPASDAKKTPSRGRRALARFTRAARTPAFGLFLFIFGPLLGVALSAVSMISSFQKVSELKSPTPDDLASGVYTGLIPASIGLGLGLGGLLILIGWLVWFLATKARPRARDVAAR